MRTSSLFAFAFAAALVGCGSADQQAAHHPGDHHPGDHPHPGKATAGAAVKKNGEAQVGDRTNCMVSGEEFVVTAESPKVEHDGKTYYLCCPGCAKSFKANPAKYIDKKPAGT